MTLQYRLACAKTNALQTVVDPAPAQTKTQVQAHHFSVMLVTDLTFLQTPDRHRNHLLNDSSSSPETSAALRCVKIKKLPLLWNKIFKYSKSDRNYFKKKRKKEKIVKKAKPLLRFKCACQMRWHTPSICCSPVSPNSIQPLLAASKPQMTGLHEGLGPCNASARNRCASYPARRHAIAANCLALVIAPRCSEQPTRIINLPDKPTRKLAC